jgi:hypothetical protein
MRDIDRQFLSSRHTAWLAPLLLLLAALVGTRKGDIHLY